MRFFDTYNPDYPDLVLDVVTYFHISNEGPGKEIGQKNVMDFCDRIKRKNKTVNPQIVARICEILCQKDWFTKLRGGTPFGLENNYLLNLRDDNVIFEDRARWTVVFNSIVYGFEYVFHAYKDVVIPLISITKEGDYSIGTGFKYAGGIITAKHCIVDSAHLAIKGYTGMELSKCKILVSTKNPDLDVAFICMEPNAVPDLFFDEGKILQRVLVMGYPKIPAFTDFLTAEEATISAKAETRLTPTQGAIAAVEKNILARVDLMLITAKIRGGNSGGPVINEQGCVVGVASQVPVYGSEVGQYDDLGYGIAVPIHHVTDIRCKGKVIEKADDFFKDVNSL